MNESHVPPGESSAADDSPIQIQATPPSAAARKDKTSKLTTAERLAREIARLDAAMVIVVVVLSFFLASFTAANSDVWMQLATGRLIAQGQYTFGVDPFSSNAQGTWVNHAWLNNFLSYLASQAFGGPETPAGGGVLVVIKALMITFLAAVLLAIRRPEQSLWAPAGSVALAMLAMSPRLLLQPTCVSYVFLGVTLWLLLRLRDADPPLSKGHLLALPALFALWVNLDSWFVLGPALVVLFLLGEWLQEQFAPIIAGPDAVAPGFKKRLALVLLLGLAACLLNPYHVKAFMLPPDLSLFSSTSPLRDEASFSTIFLSPLAPDFFNAPARGKNVAGLSYLVLVVLGIASFLLNAGAWRGWRITVWSALFLLSALWARSVPFFAVVAGPITALNLQDFAARRFGTEVRVEPSWKRWSLFGRSATVLALLALLVLAWPGWLHDFTSASHRVAWRLVVDPSLKQASEKLRLLRDEGVLRGNAYNNTPEIANYLAWFSPDSKSFFDYRTQLFTPAVTQDYVDVSQALAPRRRAAEAGGVFNWQGVFRDARRPIDHVILNGPDFLATVRSVEQLWTRGDQWTMLYMDGRTTIFAWRDPRAQAGREELQAYQYDSQARAFAADLPEADRAPEQGTDPPVRQDMFDRFLKGPGPRPLPLDETVMHMRYYFSSNRRQVLSLQMCAELTWVLFANARAAAPGSIGGVALPATIESVVQSPLVANIVNQATTQRLNFAAPGEPILAVRAARRAIAANPEDASSYVALANVYLLTSQESIESRKGEDPLLDELRHIQLVNSLNFALTLKPDLLEAHDFLLQAYAGNDYSRSRYLDLAVDHLRKWLALTEQPGFERNDEQFRELVKSRRENLKRMEELLKSRREDYLLKSERASVREKIRMTGALGGQEAELWKEALAVPDQVSQADAGQAIELLLKTGNYLYLASHPQLPDLLQRSGIDRASWYLTAMAAARGDYKSADENLAALLHYLDRSRMENALQLTRRSLVQAHPQTVLEIRRLTAQLRLETNFTVIRGVLALEAGDTRAAQTHFRTARNLLRSPQHVADVIASLSASSPLENLSLQAGVFVSGHSLFNWYERV